MLFDKEGILNIDELVAQRPTFRKIMEDQIVTDDELTNQANTLFWSNSSILISANRLRDISASRLLLKSMRSV